MNKSELRIWAKNKRKTIEVDYISSLIVSNIRKNSLFISAKNVLIYYPLKYEINLLNLIENSNKNFYLPKIDGKSLFCCPYKPGDKTKLSCFNTFEPITQSVSKSIIDLVILPALCCDKNMYRLGYGGGYYDRFLKDYSGVKIACLPSDLVVNTVYPELHDIKVDCIITEKDD